jgi:hypothetical protein
MQLMSKGDRKIFFIGEYHQVMFCRSLNFTPIAEVIEDFLKGSKGIDFMIEDDNSVKADRTPLNEVRRIVKEYENFSNFKIINLTRDLVRRYIPGQPNYRKLPYTRVHWLDPLIDDFPEDTPDSGEAMLHMFNTFIPLWIKHYREENVEAYSQESMDHCLWSILMMLKMTTYPLPLFALPNLDEDGVYKWRRWVQKEFEKSSQQDKELFFEACLSKVLEAKYFRNCIRDKRLLQMEDYKEVFWGIWIDKPPNDLENIEMFLFDIQRFFMDVFTCCRMMKKEGQWYKKIVVYAGGLHVRKCISLLEKCGYLKHEPKTPFVYNPRCIEPLVHYTYEPTLLPNTTLTKSGDSTDSNDLALSVWI